MTSRFVLPFADVGSGILPSDGAKLTFKNPGQETLKATFSDAAGSIANTNPVVSDATGLFSNIYINGNYDVVLQDKNNVQIWADSIGEFALSIDASKVKNFATLALAVADTDLTDGDTLNIAERTTGNGGGAMWDVVLSSTVTENTFNIVQGVGVGTLSLVLRVDTATTAKMWGVDGVDDSVALQAYIDFLVTQGGGTAVLDDFDFIYSKTLFLQSNIKLHITPSATLRRKSGLGDVAGTGLFITIAAMSRYRFSVNAVIFKGAISAYQGPHKNISVFNEGVIEGTLSSGGTHDVADAAGIHLEDCANPSYDSNNGMGLIEKCDGAPVRFDGTGDIAPAWTTLALADTNLSIGHTANAKCFGLRSDNTNYGFEVQNYVKGVTMANFVINDTFSHGLRPVSARDVDSYGHKLSNVLGSSYQLQEGQAYNLHDSQHLECADQIAIQIGEVDDIHVHGNHIVTGQLQHIGTGPNALRVYVVNNVWGDENNEFATDNGLINPTSIDHLYVRENLPNNTAKTIFERKSIGVSDLFRYYLSAAQTGISPGSAVKVQFNTKDFEEGSSFDPTTNFNATPAKGKYIVQGKVRVADDGGTIAIGDVITVSLFKSNVEHSSVFERVALAGTTMMDFSFLVDVNGGNTLDIRVDVGGTGTKQVLSGSTNSVIEMFPANP